MCEPKFITIEQQPNIFTVINLHEITHMGYYRNYNPPYWIRLKNDTAIYFQEGVWIKITEWFKDNGIYIESPKSVEESSVK